MKETNTNKENTNNQNEKELLIEITITVDGEPVTRRVILKDTLSELISGEYTDNNFDFYINPKAEEAFKEAIYLFCHKYNK